MEQEGAKLNTSEYINNNLPWEQMKEAQGQLCLSHWGDSVFIYCISFHVTVNNNNKQHTL